MRKAFTCIVVLILGSVVLSACDVQATPVAARVDSVSISRTQLNSMLDLIAHNTGYRCIIETNSSGFAIEGTGQNTYATSFGAAVLSLMVNRQIVDSEVARLHLETTSYVNTVGLSELAQDLTASSTTCKTQGTALIAKLPAQLKSLLLDYWTTAYLLASHLAKVPPTPAGLADYSAHHQSATDVACIGEIVVQSQSLAESLAASARRGTSFASLARANSVDTTSNSNGGNIGCAVPTDFAEQYAAVIPSLAVREISAPIPISGYYAILTVESRQTAPPTDGPSSLIRLEGTNLASFIASLSEHAKVAVDPNFGSWTKVASTWQVDPPSGPPAALVGNVAAAVPSSANTAG